MKHFERPFCEIVRFGEGVIAASGCGCYDGDIDWGSGDCYVDIAYCECKKNLNPAVANCCDKYGA